MHKQCSISVIAGFTISKTITIATYFLFAFTIQYVLGFPEINSHENSSSLHLEPAKYNEIVSSQRQRLLSQNFDNNNNAFCDKSTSVESIPLRKYFDGMDSIYHGQKAEGTCLPVHKQCGWPKVSQEKRHLPLFILSVGLEGAGHHLWTEILDSPVADCVWINGRHYQRDIGDGIPRTGNEV
jgi:hypothetical protein